MLLIKIIILNIILSGDNAFLIALSARSLKKTQQKKAIFIGSTIAIVMRIFFSWIAACLLIFPYLKIIGSVLLFYVGVNLLLPGYTIVKNECKNLWIAIRTIITADLIMSVDNVVAISALALGNPIMLILGLVISIPLIMFGSTLFIKLIENFPFIIWTGAAWLGFISGEMLLEDIALQPIVGKISKFFMITNNELSLFMGTAGSVIVVLLGNILIKKNKKKM